MLYTTLKSLFTSLIVCSLSAVTSRSTYGIWYMSVCVINVIFCIGLIFSRSTRFKYSYELFLLKGSCFFFIKLLQESSSKPMFAEYVFAAYIRFAFDFTASYLLCIFLSLSLNFLIMLIWIRARNNGLKIHHNN